MHFGTSAQSFNECICVYNLFPAAKCQEGKRCKRKERVINKFLTAKKKQLNSIAKAPRETAHDYQC